jgi:hypothetical protein
MFLEIVHPAHFPGTHVLNEVKQKLFQASFTTGLHCLSDNIGLEPRLIETALE